MKSPLQLSLLENARSFVVEALRKAVAAESANDEWKFAVLHVVQAIELSLKELLRLQHPVLIYTNVDKPGHTVSLEQALSRLKRLTSFEPTEDEKKAIELAGALRNDIVHHEFKTDIATLKPAFAHLFAFLVDFHRDHIEEPLDSHVPEQLWISGVKVREYGEELYRRAKARLEEQGLDDSVVSCPKCGWEAVTAFGDRQERCYVCGSSAHLAVCKRCNRVMIWGEHEEYEGDEFCSSCVDYLSDDYWHDSAKER
jgi:HEPN domain-containing protein